MSYIYIFLITLLISKNILCLYIKDCSDKYDCFNCTLSPGCVWLNKTCINSTEEQIYSSLLNSDNSTILFHDLKLLKYLCFETKPPYTPEENYKYEEISDKYCGNNIIILSSDKLHKGFDIKLKNNNGSYGTPKLLCEYILTHGNSRLDADIYINRTLSKNFLLFYTDDMEQYAHINYSTTLSIYGSSINSVSFFFYSNYTFETPPFIIYFKVEYIIDEVPASLTYSFLAVILLFISLSIGGIIIIRKCSIVFHLNKDNKKDKGEIIENKENLSVIIEKNIEENSKNEIEVDSQELHKIKEKNEESKKDNKTIN